MKNFTAFFSVLVVTTIFFITIPHSFRTSAQSGVTPSFYPLTTCPTCASPSNTVLTGSAPSAAEAISANPQPSIAPCSNDSSISDNAHHSKHKKHHGAISNSFESILKLLMELINKLLQLLGGGKISMPSTDTPSPSVAEENPVEQQPCSQTQLPSEQPEASQPETAPSAAPSMAAGSGTTQSVDVTFYGAYDNDPKGSTAISNPVIHQKAGGTGTYADPLTFASPTGSGEYPIGTKIYVPLAQKYFIREDTCAVSWTAPNGCGAVTHVDLYVGNPSDSQSVVSCEDSLTPSGGKGSIIVNPPSNLTVDSNPIWNQSSGTCMKAHQ
jgi:hypothetical protein